MKSHPTSSLKLLKSIKTSLVLERKDIEKKLVSEKTVAPKKKKVPTSKLKNLTVYKEPEHLQYNKGAPRKQYVINIGDVEWEDVIKGFKNTFIYETTVDPFDFDDGDSIYGVSEEFYEELLEALATSVHNEILNEPEIISITDINGNPISEKKLVSEKTPGSKNIFTPYTNMQFIAKLYIVDSKYNGTQVTHTDVNNEVKIIKGKFEAFEKRHAEYGFDNPMNLIYIDENDDRQEIKFINACKDSIMVFKNNDSVTFNDVLSDIPPRKPLNFVNAF